MHNTNWRATRRYDSDAGTVNPVRRVLSRFEEPLRGHPFGFGKNLQAIRRFGKRLLDPTRAKAPDATWDAWPQIVTRCGVLAKISRATAPFPLWKITADSACRIPVAADRLALIQYRPLGHPAGHGAQSSGRSTAFVSMLVQSVLCDDPGGRHFPRTKSVLLL